jgi:arylsulfatase A-like enzyme/Flp pilus assembly protein TadD
MSRHGRWVLGAVLLAGAVGGAWVLSRRPAPVETFRGAPVILISIDTLRADRLPAYGYRGAETPHLDGLRADSILYRHAYSPCPMTLPSHVTMLTGLLPPEHGVRSNAGFTFAAAAHPSLPVLLKAQGYATGAAVSSYVLRGETGLRPLFDEYEDSLDARHGRAFADQQRSGTVTASHARAWMEARGAAPFFFFLHLYEPHVPYEPEEPYRSRYKDPYDGEIAAADAIVGGVLDHLRRTGVYDRALIIVTSDHGEGLGDHGEEQHSILLYREAIEVPLFVKLPGSRMAGRTVETAATLSDILPTVTDALGLDTPQGLRGRSLLQLDDGEPQPGAYAETLYPRLQLGWSDLRSLVKDGWHYIHGPKPELYDLANDPAEKNDLSARESARAERMRAELERYPRGPQTPGAVDAATAERLAALGYVGTPRARGEGELANPRDSLPSLERLQQAYALALARRYDEAARLLETLTAEQPTMVEAWIKLGEVQQDSGRPEAALAAFAQASARSPAALPEIEMAKGFALLRAGRLDEAGTTASGALAVAAPKAHELLARVALAQNRLDDAAREASLAQSAQPQPSEIVLRAEIETRRGDYPSALALLDGAQTRARTLGLDATHGLEAARADALARQGRLPEAEAAYRREITAFPGNLSAWGNLAALLFAQGRRNEVEPLLVEMAQSNPNSRARQVAATAWDAFGDKTRAASWRRREAETSPK